MPSRSPSGSSFVEQLKKTIKLIPTYNEKENIASLSEAIFDLYPETSVLVLDDNSPDGTAVEGDKIQAKFTNFSVHRRTGPRGFGRSYLDGFKRVINDGRYDYVVMMDADFSHDPKEIRAMVSSLADYDLVIGSRYVPNGKIKNWNWRRKLLSRFANFYVRKILGTPIKDMTTGFMCLRKNILRSLDLNSIHSDGYAFLVELKYRLHKNGFSYLEHPITFKERREGQSKMSSKVIWESVWMPWRLRFKSQNRARARLI